MLSIDYGLVWGIVACSLGQRGFPNNRNLIKQPMALCVVPGRDLSSHIGDADPRVP